MKQWLQCLCVPAVLALSACGSSEFNSTLAADSGRQTGKATTVQLRRDGRYLVDDKNRVVLIHGVNTIWKNAPYVPPDSKDGFTAADAQWLADHGFNGARIGTLWVGVTPQAPDKIDQGYLTAWDRIVKLLEQQHIWMLFDFHQDMMSPEYQGQGVPDWAVAKLKGPINNLPPPQFGFPFNYFSPQVSELFDNLWKEKGEVWKGFGNAWVAVATRWRDQPYSMGYDLLNEPWAGQEWPQCIFFAGTGVGGCPNSDRDEIQPFLEVGRKAVRSVDPNNIAWFEAQLLSGGTGLPTGLVTISGESQAGYSFHNYCPHAAGTQSAQPGSLPVPLPVDPSTTCTPFINDVVTQGQAAATRMNAVAAMTEFGASDDLTIIKDTATAADAQFTNWFYWHYKNWKDPTTQSQGSGAQGLFTDDTDFTTVKVSKLKLVERTYPQATAGTPLALSFDPATAAFSYRYTPRAATGPTEIYVPVALHYPNGYSLQVTGARSLSAANAPHLQLENLPGATEVSVTITKL
jgi:endoglycosylceramidase